MNKRANKWATINNIGFCQVYYLLASKVYQPLVHTGKRAIRINSKFKSFSRLQEPIDEFSQDNAPVKVHKILLDYCWIGFSNVSVKCFFDGL